MRQLPQRHLLRIGAFLQKSRVVRMDIYFRINFRRGYLVVNAVIAVAPFGSYVCIDALIDVVAIGLI